MSKYRRKIGNWPKKGFEFIKTTIKEKKAHGNVRLACSGEIDVEILEEN